MPNPLAICIEELGQAETKYMRCVALPGRQPGLRLDEAGRVLWQSEDGVSCELWVSADERLILYRPEGAMLVTLHRAGRSLDVPCGKPVVVIDKDQVDVGARRLRIHIHGQAPSVAAPSPLPSEPHLLGRLAQAVAATAVIGAVVATGGCTDQSIEVRQTPPVAPPPPVTPTIEVRQAPPTATAPPSATPTIEVRTEPPKPAITTAPVPTRTATVGINTVLQVIQGAWIASQVYDLAGERVWITGTLTIQGNSYTFKPTREVKGPSVPGTLDFLFNTPKGQVAFSYGDKVKPDAAFKGFAPGDILATCVFRVNSAVVGNFLVKVRDSHSLYFDTGAKTLWSVTKQLN